MKIYVVYKQYIFEPVNMLIDIFSTEDGAKDFVTKQNKLFKKLSGSNRFFFKYEERLLKE